jgi:hypothetical protein
MTTVAPDLTASTSTSISVDPLYFRREYLGTWIDKSVQWVPSSTSSTTYYATTSVPTYAPLSTEQDWVEQQEHIRQRLASVFDIPPSLLGVAEMTNRPSTSWPSVSAGQGWFFANMRHEQENDERLKDHAREGLLALVERFPQATPVLKRAIEQGRINGSTYGIEHRSPLGEDDVRMSLSCCIIGWVMRVIETGNDYDRRLNTMQRQAVESFVMGIYPGETHETNSRLAFLYKVLEEVTAQKEIWHHENIPAWPAVSEEEAVRGVERLLADLRDLVPV